MDMPSVQDLFAKAKGQPIAYKGHTVQMVDCLRVSDGQMLKVKFESVNSDWRQGVNLTTDGSFEVNDQGIKNSIVLWHDTAPSEVYVKIHSRQGECLVKNVWDVGDGVVHSWHNGAAMIVEEFQNGRQYKCNDGRADEDFDDLVFSIELVKEATRKL